MKRCIFCPNARTTKRGEHVWDDWINREEGVRQRLPSTVIEHGVDGQLVREYKATNLAVTRPVVCDPCNHGWMSQLSSEAKATLEGFIRHERAATLLPLGILTTAAFAFMKAAVIEWVSEDERAPFITRANCLRFRRSLTDGDVWLTEGLQIWAGHYRRSRRLEARSSTEEVGPIDGHSFLVITYVMGGFIFQLAFPAWRDSFRKRTPVPTLQALVEYRDAVKIWPGVERATWPPRLAVTEATLEAFRQRLRHQLRRRRR